MVHTPSTRLNDPLRCSQGAAAIPLKPCWALRFGVVLGVLGVRCFEGCWVVSGRYWRGNWLLDWMTATTWQGLQCCWGRRLECLCVRGGSYGGFMGGC